MALKIGSRVYLTGDDFRSPGNIIGIRRSDGIYSSGQLRCRGSLYATVHWDDTGGKREYSLNELSDWDAEGDE